MILQSRRWRLLIRTAALVITSVLMLAFAGPVSYALQDDTPKPLTNPDQLFVKEKPVVDSYVTITAVPDLSHNAIAIKDGDNTSYWIPLHGFDNKLFVRIDSDAYVPYAYGEGSETLTHYSGKVTILKGQADSEKVIKELAKRGVTVDKDKVMVLVQGEEPKTFRPIVPVMPALALLWGATLIGLLQIWRGRRPRARR